MEKTEEGSGSGSSSTLISSSQPSDTNIINQINCTSFHELNFFPLPSQSNIYGLTHITVDGHNKLLVATVSGEIFRLEVDRQTLQSLWKPITFSYIPGPDELIGSTDKKLQLVKASLVALAPIGGPPKLIASSPEILCPLEDFILHVGQRITSIENPFADEGGEGQQQAGGGGGGEGEVDFTRIEDFFRLETKIDAKNDHTLLKLALASQRGSFMSGILDSFTIPHERLAFIQQINGQVLHHTNGVGGARLSSSSTSHVPLGHNGMSTGDPSNDKDQKDLVISCQVCGEMFNVLARFQRHILTHPDPENKKFLCQFCGKRFNRADHLNRHAVLHGDVSLKCLLCGEDFDRASHLDRHRRKNHPPLGQAPSQTPPLTPQERVPPINLYLESITEGTMDLGANLHLLAAVATPENAQQMDPEQVLEHLDAAQVVSQILQSETEQQQQLGTSSKQPPDSIERPYVCEVCDRKFIRSTHLRRHMRIHTGEKPFACHICGRRYARGDYLRAHINAHRRDRVHKCKRCNEVFHDLTRFAEHCRVVHRNDEEDDEFGASGGTGGLNERPSTPDHTHQVETFTLYDDIPLSSFDPPPQGRSFSNDIHDKDDVVMTTYSTSDLGHTFTSGSDFLQFVPPPSSAQTNSHTILQNGSLSFPDSATGHDITVMGGVPEKSAPPLLDPLAHLIIQNSEPLDVLRSHAHHKLH